MSGLNFFNTEKIHEYYEIFTKFLDIKIQDTLSVFYSRVIWSKNEYVGTEGYSYTRYGRVSYETIHNIHLICYPC